MAVDVLGAKQRCRTRRDDDGVVAGRLVDENIGGAGVALRRLDHRRDDAGLAPGGQRHLGEGVARRAG